MLTCCALAEHLNHPAVKLWDERINSFYVQNNYPDQGMNAELERVEGGFGVTPQQHFNGLRNLLPQLKGLAILDNVMAGIVKAFWMAPSRSATGNVTRQKIISSPRMCYAYARTHYVDLELFGVFSKILMRCSRSHPHQTQTRRIETSHPQNSHVIGKTGISRLLEGVFRLPTSNPLYPFQSKESLLKVFDATTWMFALQPGWRTPIPSHLLF